MNFFGPGFLWGGESSLGLSSTEEPTSKLEVGWMDGRERGPEARKLHSRVGNKIGCRLLGAAGGN